MWGVFLVPDATCLPPAYLTRENASWEEADVSCRDAGLQLCSQDQICQGGAPVVGAVGGDVWLPTSDADNSWISVGTLYPARMCQTHEAVAGLLVPGDLVDIFASIDTSAADGEAPAAGDAGTFGIDARLLYHQVRILAIGTEAAPQPGEQAAADDAAAPAPVSSGLITLDLPVEAAQLISSQLGQISLALTGPDYQALPIPRIDLNEVEDLPGETDARTRFGTLTPYGPDGPQ